MRTLPQIFTTHTKTLHLLTLLTLLLHLFLTTSINLALYHLTTLIYLNFLISLVTSIPVNNPVLWYLLVFWILNFFCIGEEDVERISRNVGNLRGEFGRWVLGSNGGRDVREACAWRLRGVSRL
jgi:hypothetical protein